MFFASHGDFVNDIWNLSYLFMLVILGQGLWLSQYLRNN